jgi:phage gp29-like protein
MTQSWSDAVSEWLSCLWAGYQLSYPVYKYNDDNKLIWDYFSPRKQSTVYQWLINYPDAKGYDKSKPNGSLLGVTQQAYPSYALIDIPAERLLHFRTRSEIGNPEGISILRGAWISYYFLKNYMTAEAIGFERDVNGLPVITMTEGATTDENDDNSDFSRSARAVRNIRVDEQAGLVLPHGYVFELASSSGKSFAELGKAIERLESRILMVTLSQFLMLGQSGVGSLALSQDASDIAESVVNATADMIAETFTKQEIPRILRMNGWNDSRGICLEHTPAGDTDINAYAEFIQKSGDKITWREKDEVWLRQVGGLPEVSEDEIKASKEEENEYNDNGQGLRSSDRQIPQRGEDRGDNEGLHDPDTGSVMGERARVSARAKPTRGRTSNR